MRKKKEDELKMLKTILLLHVRNHLLRKFQEVSTPDNNGCTKSVAVIYIILRSMKEAPFKAPRKTKIKRDETTPAEQSNPTP